MTATPDDPPEADNTTEEIGRGAERMRAARDNPPLSPVRGVGVFGMVGWTVAVPTVGGIFLGLWFDRVAPQAFSWTITLLFAGLVVGIVIAWRWIGRENRPDPAPSTERKRP